MSPNEPDSNKINIKITMKILPYLKILKRSNTRKSLDCSVLSQFRSAQKIWFTIKPEVKTYQLQYFFRLCVVTVTVALPSRYMTVTDLATAWPNVTNRSSTWPTVHQRDWSLPQRYPPFINVTQRYPTLLNVTHRYPRLLNVTQRDLNMIYFILGFIFDSPFIRVIHPSFTIIWFTLITFTLHKGEAPSIHPNSFTIKGASPFIHPSRRVFHP